MADLTYGEDRPLSPTLRPRTHQGSAGNGYSGDLRPRSSEVVSTEMSSTSHREPLGRDDDDDVNEKLTALTASLRARQRSAEGLHTDA